MHVERKSLQHFFRFPDTANRSRSLLHFQFRKSTIRGHRIRCVFMTIKCRYVEENGSAVMLAAQRPAGVKPDVSQRESVTHMSLPVVNMAAHSGFETQGRCHQKSRTVYQWPHRNDLCLPKNHKNLKKELQFTNCYEEILLCCMNFRVF